MIKLIADTRERNVLRHNNVFAGHSLEVKQISVGDYVIKAEGTEPRFLAVIERKSLEDFAASLKDGRHDNKNKLIDLREKTGCRIIYIIEGPPSPLPTDCFGNIPYRHIESSIFHLIIRDGICVINSVDTLDTARKLVRFCDSMETLLKKTPDVIESPAVKTPDVIPAKPVTTSRDALDDHLRKLARDQAQQPKEDSAIAAVIKQHPILLKPPAQNREDSFNNVDEIPHRVNDVNNIENVETQPNAVRDDAEMMALLTATREKTLDEIVRAMWSAFPGISVESSSEFMSKFSIADIVCGRIPRADIAKLKTAIGRTIGKNVITALCDVQLNVQIRLLSNVPGVSTDTAKKLLRGTTLRTFISQGAGGMEMCIISNNPTRVRRVGPKLAKKIEESFNYSTKVEVG